MNKDFFLSTDASGSAVGYVLGQKDEQGKEGVIAYGGRALSKNERKWSVTDQECLAVIEGIKAFRHYLSHRKFIVQTDHKVLSYLNSVKDPKGRIARWLMFLENYNFDILYRPGTQNGNADGLSRIPYSDNVEVDVVGLDEHASSESNSTCSSDSPWLESEEDCSTNESDDSLLFDKLEQSVKTNQVNSIESGSFDCATTVEVTFQYGQPASICLVDDVEQTSDEDMASLQRKCPTIGFIFEYLEKGTLPDDEKKKRTCVHSHNQFLIKDGLLYRLYQPNSKREINHEEHFFYQLALPETKIGSILNHYHDSLAGGGHFGVNRTLSKIQQKYWFPQMHQKVIDYVSACNICQRTKINRRQQPPPLKPLPVMDEPMSRIHIDIMGPLPKTKEGYQYVLLIIDSFSKWSEAFPLASQNAKEIASVLYNEFICRYGAPRAMVSDRGRNFMSKLVAALCELFEIKRYFTSAYHPQTNSMVERANSTLAKVLSAYVNENQTNWASLLPSVMMAFRSTPATESHGFSPFQLVFGKEMLLPVDVGLLPKPSLPNDTKVFFDGLLSHLQICRDIAKKKMKNVQKKTKQRFDRKAKVPDFLVQDKVLLRCNATKPGLSPKLSQKWDGPYEIVSARPNFTYKLKSCQTGKVLKAQVNAQRLKHFQEDIHAHLTDLDESDNVQLNDDPLAQQSESEPQPVVQENKPVEVNSHCSNSDTVAYHPQVNPQAKSVESPSDKIQKSVLSQGPHIKCPKTNSTLIVPKRIVKIIMQGGIRYFRCYLHGQRKSVWLLEHQINPEFLCKYWQTHTKSRS